MNSLRYLVAYSAQKEAESRPQPASSINSSVSSPKTHRSDPTKYTLSLWIWQWVVYILPFLVKLAPAELQRLKKRERKYSKSHSRSASLPPIPKLFTPQPRKMLVLDLDETLIHSMTRGSHRNCQLVEVKKADSLLTSFYYVAKRPFCADFLNTVTQWYDLAIFTASISEYADPIIDLLERDLGRPVFKRRFYRDSCSQTDDGYIKNLKILDMDMSRVILIDNSPVSYRRDLYNGLAIEGWISDPSDRELLQLLPLLFALRHTSDVRSILSLHNSQMLPGN